MIDLAMVSFYDPIQVSNMKKALLLVLLILAGVKPLAKPLTRYQPATLNGNPVYASM